MVHPEHQIVANPSKVIENELYVPMDGAISATASIASVGVAIGAALGAVGGFPGIALGVAIGGSVGALAGTEMAESANHAEELANEENHHPEPLLTKPK